MRREWATSLLPYSTCISVMACHVPFDDIGRYALDSPSSLLSYRGTLSAYGP